jgi:hypothetical protein
MTITNQIIIGGSIALLFVLILLLIFAVYLIKDIYICEKYNCRAFLNSGYGEKSDLETIKILLYSLISNCIWPFALVGSIVISIVIPWLLTLIHGIEIFNLITISIVFLVSFLVIYGILSFITFHFLTPISEYVLRVLEKELI